MESLYEEVIRDHYRHPVGKGLREPYEAQVHHVNPTCGDEITLRVHLSGTDDDARVIDISYDNDGCSISQASASMLHELLLHHTVADDLRIHEQFLALMQSATEDPGELDEDALGDAMAFTGTAQYPSRIKCALLPWMAWKDAVAQAMAAGPVGGLR